MTRETTYTCDECGNSANWTEITRESNRSRTSWTKIEISALNYGANVFGMDKEALVCSLACLIARLKRLAGEIPDGAVIKSAIAAGYADLVARAEAAEKEAAAWKAELNKASAGHRAEIDAARSSTDRLEAELEASRDRPRGMDRAIRVAIDAVLKRIGA